MKTKVLVLTLIACIAISGFGFADEILVSINNKFINQDEMVIVKSGVTYGLLSDFAGRMGVEVKWLENAKLAVMKIGEDYVSFQMDTNLVMINNTGYEMPYNTIMKDGKIYVPIDSLFKQLGIEYKWDPKLLLAQITSEQLKVDAAEIRKVKFTEEDVLWLSRIIEAESRSGSLNKKIAVANVVLNRVADPRFPNTVYGVIFAHNQFTPTRYNSFLSLVPSETSVIAAKRALMGVVVAEDCLYFNNSPFSWRADYFYKLIEGDYFYQ